MRKATEASTVIRSRPFPSSRVYSLAACCRAQRTFSGPPSSLTFVPDGQRLYPFDRYAVHVVESARAKWMWRPGSSGWPPTGTPSRSTRPWSCVPTTVSEVDSQPARSRLSASGSRLRRTTRQRPCGAQVDTELPFGGVENTRQYVVAAAEYRQHSDIKRKAWQLLINPPLEHDELDTDHRVECKHGKMHDSQRNPGRHPIQTDRRVPSTRCRSIRPSSAEATRLYAILSAAPVLPGTELDRHYRDSGPRWRPDPPRSDRMRPRSPPTAEWALRDSD